MDHSIDSEVELEGLQFDYATICNAAAVSTHKTKIEADKARKEAEKRAEARVKAEKEQVRGKNLKTQLVLQRTFRQL